MTERKITSSDILLYTFECPSERVHEAYEIFESVLLESLPNTYDYYAEKQRGTLQQDTETYIGLGTAPAINSMTGKLKEAEFELKANLTWGAVPNKPRA